MNNVGVWLVEKNGRPNRIYKVNESECQHVILKSAKRQQAVMTIAAMAMAALAGGAVKPDPLTDQERMTQTAADRVAMFGSQEPLTGPLTLDQAFSRALK